jgi:hypothetical protein
LHQKLVYILLVTLFFANCGKDDEGQMNTGSLQITIANVGSASLLSSNNNLPVSNNITLGFNLPINPSTNDAVKLSDQNGEELDLTFENLDNNKILLLNLADVLLEGKDYTLSIGDQLTGALGELFEGIDFNFTTALMPLEILSLRAGDQELILGERNPDIALDASFEFALSHPVDPLILEEEILLVGPANYNFSLEAITDTLFKLVPNEEMEYLSKFNLLFPSSIGTEAGRPFETVSYQFYSALDTTPKFPVISDTELLDLVQEQTFKYFWDFGHPVSGMARERNTSNDIVTTGGSGFGLMAMVVGVERGFITRTQAIERFTQIVGFLETADRFHGAWPHWLNGNTGEVQAFSLKDNGGDLVETALLLQGLLTVRAFLDPSIMEEDLLADRITTLWEEVEWTWYTQGGQNVLYWHWSPQYEWEINLPVRGHNETQIVYILAAASPTFPIEKIVYDEGYARSGNMQNGNTFYNLTLPLGNNLGGPLFFSHYSYLGLDPRNLSDQYANYWTQNINHSLINQAYCIDNPQQYIGYSAQCWGLTASDNQSGYSAHSPTNDLGVITPTAALSSMPYTPDASMQALRHFYYHLGDRLWGDYGFYDAFNPTAGWVASSYLAIDQGPIVCMIENHRSGLLWNLFMTIPEVQNGLDLLDFEY